MEAALEKGPKVPRGAITRTEQFQNRGWGAPPSASTSSSWHRDPGVLERWRRPGLTVMRIGRGTMRRATLALHHRRLRAGGAGCRPAEERRAGHNERFQDGQNYGEFVDQSKREGREIFDKRQEI